MQPFRGEVMQCVVCGKLERSDPRCESQWRAISMDGRMVYACPAEFPPDATGTRAQFQTAYQRVLLAILANEGGACAVN